MFTRATDILDGLANGFGIPILQHLALRGYGPALLWLAGELSCHPSPADRDRPCDSGSPIALRYRAHRLGELNAAQNLAMTYFARNDLARYRHWLRIAALGGDEDAMRELKRFALRQPYRFARRLRRLRPVDRSGF